MVCAGAAGLAGDRHPYLVRRMGRELVKTPRREQADDAARNCARSAICFMVVILLMKHWSYSAGCRQYSTRLFSAALNPLILYHCASWTQRKPKAAERSMLGAIIRSFPCSVSLYACGKYQMDP